MNDKEVCTVCYGHQVYKYIEGKETKVKCPQCGRGKDESKMSIQTQVE